MSALAIRLAVGSLVLGRLGRLRKRPQRFEIRVVYFRSSVIKGKFLETAAKEVAAAGEAE